MSLAPALLQELLDPAIWCEELEKYARAMHLAIALVDLDGQPVAACLNAQPLWRMLHAQQMTTTHECPFSLVDSCNCVARALKSKRVVRAKDRTGLIHFALPLTLGPRNLGAIVAGQVFDQYPEQSALERTATKLGLSSTKVWQTARLEHLVPSTMLGIDEQLLSTFARSFVESRYHKITEAARLAEVTQLNEKLAEANRRKDEFLAMLAHELRNPLAPIRSAIQLMHVAKDDPDRREAEAVVERQVQHMSRLVDDLLDVARFNNGKITLQKEPIDVAALIPVVIEELRPAIEARGDRFSVALPTNPLWVQADPVRIAQVVGNLLKNAAKFTPKSGKIRLSISQEDTAAVIRVRDTGVGIPPAMLSRIFDLFVQADQGLAHSSGGLGVGLTLVKKLVELHGGSVEAHSAGRNRGSKFVVRLPLLVGSPPHDARTDVVNDIGRSPRRLLVVDDNGDNAVILAKLLRHGGHEVQTADGGQAALEIARVYRPEAILLDIGLPDMDGYEVARRLRKQPETKNILLIALTGYGQEEDRRRTQEAGFDHHLLKPVHQSEIEGLLSSLATPANA